MVNDSAVTSVDDWGIFQPCSGDSLSPFWEHQENCNGSFLSHIRPEAVLKVEANLL